MSSATTNGQPTMGIVTCDLAISIDGFSSGPNQSLDHPFGDSVETSETLHRWMFAYGDAHRAELAAILDAGAFIMGRNMFTPGRGEWDLEWTGWWGDEPPYHAPVFVLTNHAREPLEMKGGTTFHFVTDGPAAAMAQARQAAGERNVSIAGGVSTVNQFLASGAIDELRLHIAPVNVGADYERIFDGVPKTNWSSVSGRWTPEVSHVTYHR